MKFPRMIRTLRNRPGVRAALISLRTRMSQAGAPIYRHLCVLEGMPALHAGSGSAAAYGVHLYHRADMAELAEGRGSRPQRLGDASTGLETMCADVWQWQGERCACQLSARTTSPMLFHSYRIR